jgi:outer membrane immunogenic protein
MKFLSTSMIFCVAAVPALAGSLDETTPETVAAPVYVEPGTDWTGGYGGVQLGYGTVSSASDWVAGLYAGYWKDTGNWAFGAEASYDWTNIRTPNIRLDALGALKLKAGYDLGTTLVYGVVGAVYGDVDLRNNLNVGNTTNDWGWQAGFGADYKLSDATSIGAEVLWHQFDNFSGSGVNLNATTVAARFTYGF